MPKIDQTHTIDISAERFLNACSPAELFDVDRLMRQRRYQDKIEQMITGVISEHAEDVTNQISPAQAQVAGRAMPKYCMRCKKPKVLVLLAGQALCETCIGQIVTP